MKNSTNPIWIIALLLAAVAPATADIPAPKNNSRTSRPYQVITAGAAKKTPMSIEPSHAATEARLVIPRSVLAQLTAEIERDDPETIAASGPISKLNDTRTVMAGLFLSLALGFGGVWFVHSRKRTDKLPRAALGVAVLALYGATATIASGNAGPPPEARSLTSKILIPGADSFGAHGQVKVVIVEEGNRIRLILPKD